MRYTVVAILAVALQVGYTFYTPDYDYMRDTTVLVEIVNGEGKTVAHGSGVLVEEGVLTAGHVARYLKSTDGYIRFRHGEKEPAKIVKIDYIREGKSLKADLALLSIDNNHNYPTAPIFCGVQPVGTDLFIVGNPMDNRWAVTQGHVMSVHPRKGFEKGAWLQIDGTIWVGNSGGPVFNRYGYLVGIVSHAASANGGPTGLNYGVSGQKICKLLKDN